MTEYDDVDDRVVAFDTDRREHRRGRPLEVLDPLHWHDQPVPERRWLVKGLIPLRNVTILSGDGGLGKSLLAMQLLTACATGNEWLNCETMNCRALGVFCEDDTDELHRRHADINRHYDIEFADLGDLNISSRVGDDSILMEWAQPWKPGYETEIYNQVYRYCRDNGVQCLVLDSLHDLFAGNENQRSHARQFINALRDIAIAMDGAVIITAHPSLSGRASGTGESGNTAWNNTARGRLYLKTPDNEDDEDVRVLSNKKSNYGRKGREMRLHWSDGVFINLDPPISGTVAGIAKNNCDGVFLTLLDAFNKEGRMVSEKLRASNYAPRAFAMRPDRRGHSKKDFQFAMERLFADGKIRVETYASKGRPCERIVKI